VAARNVRERHILEQQPVARIHAQRRPRRDQRRRIRHFVG
jgi:hypothetical protein